MKDIPGLGGDSIPGLEIIAFGHTPTVIAVTWNSTALCPELPASAQAQL